MKKKRQTSDRKRAETDAIDAVGGSAAHGSVVFIDEIDKESVSAARSLRSG